MSMGYIPPTLSNYAVSTAEDINYLENLNLQNSFNSLQQWDKQFKAFICVWCINFPFLGCIMQINFYFRLIISPFVAASFDSY